MLLPFLNSPPLNTPNISKKAVASAAERLATIPPIVHNSSQNPPLKFNPHPQTIRSTETNTPTINIPSPPKVLSPIETYINSLKTQGKNVEEILQVLQMCYEEPKEEIAHVSTNSDF
jgi:hypothetical protein